MRAFATRGDKDFVEHEGKVYVGDANDDTTTPEAHLQKIVDKGVVVSEEEATTQDMSHLEPTEPSQT